MSTAADLSAEIARLEAQEDELVLARFTQEDAWTLGKLIAERALADGHGILVDIRRPSLVLFRSSLPGSKPDHEIWAGKKAAVVLRMESSSALFAARMQAAGVDPVAIGWLDSDYAVTGGSFPIRVHGVGVVAAVTASGLSSEDDHTLVTDGVRALIAQQSS
ncbi:MAG: heme-binding protein [Mycetocola sp.]